MGAATGYFEQNLGTRPSRRPIESEQPRLLRCAWLCVRAAPTGGPGGGFAATA